MNRRQPRRDDASRGPRGRRDPPLQRSPKSPATGPSRHTPSLKARRNRFNMDFDCTRHRRRVPPGDPPPLRGHRPTRRHPSSSAPYRAGWSRRDRITGGRPLHILDQIAERYPIVMHGVSMSIGSTDEIDFSYLAKVKALAERTGALWISRRCRPKLGRPPVSSRSPRCGCFHSRTWSFPISNPSIASARVRNPSNGRAGLPCTGAPLGAATRVEPRRARSVAHPDRRIPAR